MKLLRGDCLDELKKLESCQIDSLITDPPAGISFMGKDWDNDKGGRDKWITWMTGVMKECLRVLKPGAHGLVWALPRTSHWTATACENAGFEVRDVVTHLFGTGFPKSLDISKAIDKAAGAEREVISIGNSDGANRKPRSMNPGGGAVQAIGKITAPSTEAAKQWQGWGTALKPACEMWVLIRKPCSEKTVAANVLKHGCGGLNIDASRIGTSKDGDPNRFVGRSKYSKTAYVQDSWTKENYRSLPINPNQGRFPANLVFSHTLFCTDEVCDESCAVKMLDLQSGVLKSGDLKKDQYKNGKKSQIYGKYGGLEMPCRKGDSGGASRFFYCAKVSKSERGEGNVHPTVKAQKLMQYLIRMITPPNGTVLDPFMGSGSTGLAAKSLGFSFIGIERDEEYFEIAKRRVG